MNKRIWALLLTLMLCVGLAATASAATITPAQPTNGDGSANNPYQITTAGELKWFQQSASKSASAILMNNIVYNENVIVNDVLTSDTSGLNKWTSMGTNSSPYTGTFDGNGKSIIGLYLDNVSSNYQGLFGCVNGATIKDLTVVDSYFNASTGTAHGQYIGAFVGGTTSNGNGVTITNCHNSGSIVRGGGSIGGILGYSQRSTATITNCTSSGTITGINSSGAYTGGIVGYSDYGSAAISGCRNSGTITSASGHAGGIVGSTNSTTGTISGCTNTGTVRYMEGTTGNAGAIGGVAGSNSLDMSNCHNQGQVIGYAHVGGVVGSNSSSGSMTNCTNIGNLTADTTTTNSRVGGVVYKNSGTISNCSNSGNITGMCYLGGLACYNNGTISNCTNTGNVTATSTSASYPATSGGLLAITNSDSKNGTIENSHNTGKVSGNQRVGGVAGSIEYGCTFTNCYNSGEVVGTGTNSQDIGGIFGYYNSVANGSGCYNEAAVSGYQNVGGVAGWVNKNLSNCYNSGTVNGTQYVGGVAGFISNGYPAPKVSRCYNIGSVSGSSYVGGVTGNTRSNVENCYNTGAVSGTSNVGGVAGAQLSTNQIKYCYNVGTVTGTNNLGGIIPSLQVTNCYYLDTCVTGGKIVSGANALTKEQMTDNTNWKTNYAGFDTTTPVWSKDNNHGTTGYLPRLDSYSPWLTIEPVHEHIWVYNASSMTITATCTAANCPNRNGGSVSIAPPDNLVYSGEAIEAKVTDTLKTGDPVSVEYSGENLGTDSKPTKPGTYTAKIRLDDEEVSVTYTIGKATLSSAGTGAASGTYGAKLSELTLDASGLTAKLGDTTIEGTWALTGDTIPGVNTASATATFTPNANEDCYKPLTATVKLDIEKKSVTAVVVAFDKVYDGTVAAEVTASVADSDLVSGDSITISGLTGTFAKINVGTDKVVTVDSASVRITGTGADNYEVTIPTTETASISKKPLTIAASAQSIAFGGSISEAEYTCGELAAGDALESVTLTATGTDGVGTGTITPSAAQIIRGADDVTDNYDITFVDGVLNVGKQTIGSVSAAVTAPVQGEAPQSSVAPGTNYSGTITWSPAVTDGVFGFDTAYTATVTLTPDSNHAFADTTTIPEGFSKTLNADGTLTLTQTFANTRLPNLTKLKTELGNTLSVYCKDAAEAIELLPTQMTFETETGDLTLDVQWSCGSYDPEVGETNTFAWAVKQSAWEAVEDSYHQNGVPLNGTVDLTNAQAVPVAITGVAAAQGLVYDGAAKQGYTGTPTSAEYAGPFTITYTGTKADGSSYGPTSDAPADAGEYTVIIAVPATGTAYSGQTQISFSIAKATPTGEPVFTPIYRDGKTLADAGLTTAGGTFSVEGAVAWNDPLTTVVEEGKAYGWTFTPTDSGNYAPITGSVVVYPVGDAPVIDEPAEMQTVSVAPGGTATMTVAAQGTGELSYQWYISYDGGKTFEPISGATQPSYTTSAVTTENNGYQYYCLVTNLYGETKSPVFTLSVVNPAVLPETGDNSHLALWLMMMSVAGAAMLMLRKRVHN